MRYTKKGQQKLVDYLYAYGAYVSGLRANAPDPLVFESDDFEGVVVLTVEEASEVWDSLVNLVSYAESMEGSLSDLVRDGQRNIDLIRNQIKKAEKEE